MTLTFRSNSKFQITLVFIAISMNLLYASSAFALLSGLGNDIYPYQITSVVHQISVCSVLPMEQRLIVLVLSIVISRVEAVSVALWVAMMAAQSATVTAPALFRV
jgi:hypothetical protein